MLIADSFEMHSAEDKIITYSCDYITMAIAYLLYCTLPRILHYWYVRVALNIRRLFTQFSVSHILLKLITYNVKRCIKVKANIWGIDLKYVYGIIFFIFLYV